MVVAVLAGLGCNVFNQFFVDSDLVLRFMIFNIFTGKTPGIGDMAPIARFFVHVKKKRLFLGKDRGIRITLEMLDKKPDSGFVHVHPSLKSGIEMAFGTVPVVLGRSRRLPFFNGICHFMTDDTGFILKINH
jgi:hypothetical protein